MIEFAKMAIPIILGFLGQTLMGLVDVLYVGRVSTEAIGAVGIGTQVFNAFMVLGSGLFSGLEYFVSYARGENRPDKQRSYFFQTLWIACFLALPATGILLWVSHHLQHFSINPVVIPHALTYLNILAWSLLPTYLFSLMRTYLNASAIQFAPMAALIGGNVLNLILNDLLVLGHFGAPRLEVAGSAWATLISRWVMVFGMLIFIRSHHRKGPSLLVSLRPEWEKIKAILKLGTPAALQLVVEVGVFTFSMILAARLSGAELAAHQIVTQLISVTFMIPLGLGIATAVFVGHSLGKKQVEEAKAWGWFGIKAGAGVMGLLMVFLLLAPNWILGAFTMDPAVIEVSLKILFLGALFQIFDGVQVVALSALRGLGETKIGLIANLISHWMIGVPLGTWLCFGANYGLPGLWFGLTVGLITVSVVLLGAWIKRSRELKI